jgi:peptidoglycan/xylan/chitin deacetylase (PgdA/CDA1 family)
VWQSRRDARNGRAPIIVLFYHRVADDVCNGWTCSNHDFVRQMVWLNKRFEMISLAEAQRRVRDGNNKRPAVSITFDDGYADNCVRALPFLIEQKIPCTYFVSTRFVLEQLPFPHDLAQGYALAPNTPEQLREMAEAGIDIGAHTHTHTDLSRVVDRRQLHQEVVEPREMLERLTGRPVRYFAFPYGLRGNLNVSAFQMAYEAGYHGVCSAYGGYNFPGDDAFHLQRIHGDPEMVRVKNWVTLDPRKRRTERYRYADLLDQSPPESTADIPPCEAERPGNTPVLGAVLQTDPAPIELASAS